VKSFNSFFPVWMHILNEVYILEHNKEEVSIVRVFKSLRNKNVADSYNNVLLLCYTMNGLYLNLEKEGRGTTLYLSKKGSALAEQINELFNIISKKEVKK
jgi:hypothetical protein